MTNGHSVSKEASVAICVCMLIAFVCCFPLLLQQSAELRKEDETNVLVVQKELGPGELEVAFKNDLKIMGPGAEEELLIERLDHMFGKGNHTHKLFEGPKKKEKEGEKEDKGKKGRKPLRWIVTVTNGDADTKDRKVAQH